MYEIKSDRYFNVKRSKNEKGWFYEYYCIIKNSDSVESHLGLSDKVIFMRIDLVVSNIEREIAPPIGQNKSCRILHNTVDLSEGYGAPFSIVGNKLAVVNISVLLSTWSSVKDGIGANFFPD